MSAMEYSHTHHGILPSDTMRPAMPAYVVHGPDGDLRGYIMRVCTCRRAWCAEWDAFDEHGQMLAAVESKYRAMEWVMER